MNSNYDGILASCWADGINNANSMNEGLSSFLRGNRSLSNSYTNLKEYSLYSRDIKVILPYYAFEVTKFACASLETILNISYNEVIHPKSQNWNIIKLYYAAFYAAHSILRSFGISVTMVDKNTATAIERKLGSGGYPLSKVSKGEHNITSNTNLRTVDVKFIGDLGNGTHERFWLEFSKAIEKIKISVPNAGITASDKSDVVAQIRELEAILKMHGNTMYSWLSSFRNDITYKNSHGVWFPYTQELGDIDVLASNLDLWRLNPELISLSGANVLQSFTYACHYIISLCNLNILNLNKASDHNNNLYRNRYVGLFNMRQVQIST
jgi:hypothetical protein